MDDLLIAVQTSRHDQTLSISTQGRNPSENIQAQNNQTQPKALTGKELSSLQDVLDVLKSNPTSDQVYAVLYALDPADRETAKSLPDIRLPSPAATQILQVLISVTLRDHWNTLQAEYNAQRPASRASKARGALLRCFCSIAGINVIVGHLQTQLKPQQSSPNKDRDPGRNLVIRDVTSFIAALLEPTDVLFRIHQDLLSLHGPAGARKVAWREACSLLAGGKLLSVLAEVTSSIDESNSVDVPRWLIEGNEYAGWLGRQLAFMSLHGKHDDEDYVKDLALVVGRALSLGYSDRLVKELYTTVFVNDETPRIWNSLCTSLRPREQIVVVQSILRDLERTFFLGFDEGSKHNKTISGVAALLSKVIGFGTFLDSEVRSWLATGREDCIKTIDLRRSIIARYSDDEETIKDLFKASLQQFGDTLVIKHSALQVQEANAQVVLLSAGYLHRLNSAEVHNIGRTSLFLNAVSNRLAATSSRARFIGMIVGMAISELIEPPGKAMKFDLEELESAEAKSFLALTKTYDKIGTINDLRGHWESRRTTKPTGKSKQRVTARPTPLQESITESASKTVLVEEVPGDGNADSEVDDLIPYAKPDSDASDSEEDPTLINRAKPSNPIYIRDLIAYLKDSDNADRYHLGITHAESLIRRKSAFGTELVESIEELASTIMSLDDKYKLPNFHEYRLQAMIALLVAQPTRMGRFFSITFFDGDLSQTQRSAILTALGLSARELAGHKEEDSKAMGLLPPSSDTSFPTKQLPDHLKGFYRTADDSPIGALTDQMTRTSLKPLALHAADEAAGPDVLKVRTFSSRMEVERKRQLREDERKRKSTTRDLHKVLTEGYFYPLVGRFGMMMQSLSLSSLNPFHSPHLLQLFIRTVTVVLWTLGPHTPSLPTLTQEALSLIMALHSIPVSSESIVLPALLSLFLAIIDLNIESGSSGEERLVTDNAAQVMELREWTNEVFDRLPAPQNTRGETMNDHEQSRILAAGILIKLNEVIERYQGRLMGIPVGFSR